MALITCPQPCTPARTPWCAPNINSSWQSAWSKKPACGRDGKWKWSDPGFITNSVDAEIIATIDSTAKPISTTLPEDADHASCDCDTVRLIDPVYAEAYLYVGAGVGLNRSKVIICEASAENLGNITPEGCPIRELEYLVHINRITENHVIDRSKNVKSKN